jgi:hypothetical protein
LDFVAQNISAVLLEFPSDLCKVYLTDLLEQLHQFSVCDHANEIWIKKSKHADLAQQNGFDPAVFQCAEAGKRHSKA